MLSKPFIFMQDFFKIGPEIRKLWWFEYIQKGCHTAQIKYAQPNYKGFSKE